MTKRKLKVSEGKSFLNGDMTKWKCNKQNVKHGRFKDLRNYFP